MRTIIKNGTIVTAQEVFQADLLIEGEKIVSISQKIIPDLDDRIIDASGQYVFPGGIDVHTHLANTEKNDFESGTIAAAAGGTTCVINMTTPEIGQSVTAYLEDWKEKSAESVIDYSNHFIISGTGYNDDILDEIPVLAEQGITSLKIFMAYKGQTMINDPEIYKVMKKAAELDLTVAIHAENGDIIEEMINEHVEQGKTDPIYHAKTRPPEMEAEAVARAAAIAEVTGAKIYIVHLSCDAALKEAIHAKQRGIDITVETCPQYLVLDEEYLTLPDFEGGKYVCSPPLRERWNQESLWRGIRDGVITVVGSDHCSYDFQGQKTIGRRNFAEIPNGVPGIEDRFLIVYQSGVVEGRISLQKFVEIMCTKPAEVFGLSSKGSISVGKDADLVLLDPNRERTITKEHQKQANDYNLYEGMKVNGSITHVFSRGEMIVRAGEFTGTKKRGRFIKRTAKAGI
ncbi:dihydropyrimidinase [Paenibacillus sp. sgz302251]|uniref:dihydropyrimidinase n=1 Tax=Paenibacillus sp. sgz302251 TaxID=3414493 RepID=UPI003C7B6A88